MPLCIVSASLAFIGALDGRSGDRGSDFIRPGRFAVARAVEIDPIRRDIFIADAGQDSVFKFSVRGFLKSDSFGFVRTGGAMIRPVGVAFFERVLSVLDGASGVVLGFRLTTDAPR